MNKICIIGIRATGKSTLARTLERQLGIPAYFTDALWWKPNWQVAEESYVRKEVHTILSKDEWIIEGYIEPLGKEKLEQADIVVYLDYSPLSVLINGFKRYFQHRKTPRAELPEGCVETMTWDDFTILLLRKERAEIEEAVKNSTIQKLLRFKSRKELQDWMQMGL